MKKTFVVLCAVCLMLTFLSVKAERSELEQVFAQPADRMNAFLARESAALCQTSYAPDGQLAHLEGMGFEADSIRQLDYESTDRHSAAVTFARQQMMDDEGKSYTLYVIVVRGTSTSQEMTSNFYVGNGDISAGFQLAAERVYGHWQEYSIQYPPEGDAPFRVWVTGHSRGAAVANLLAGEYLPREMMKEQIYAYTFATPNVQKTVDATANIFNFIIVGDVVTRVPPSEWGFSRHGTDVYYEQVIMGDTALNTKEDTERLMQTILCGGLTQEKYLAEVEPLLFVEGEGQESLNSSSMLLIFLQSSSGTTAENPMLLSDMIAYSQLMMPTHRIETYIAWMGMLQ